jgi:hypothetical protein
MREKRGNLESKGRVDRTLKSKECPENKEELSGRAGPLWKRKINLIINE